LNIFRHHPTPSQYPIGITLVLDWGGYSNGQTVNASGVLTSPEHCTSIDIYFYGLTTYNPTVQASWSQGAPLTAYYGYHELYLYAYYDDGRTAEQYLYVTISPPA